MYVYIGIICMYACTYVAMCCIIRNFQGAEVALIHTLVKIYLNIYQPIKIKCKFKLLFIR